MQPTEDNVEQVSSNVTILTDIPTELEKISVYHVSLVMQKIAAVNNLTPTVSHQYSLYCNLNTFTCLYEDPIY